MPLGIVIAIFAGVLIVFPLFWSGVLGLISLGGWRKLARQYREMRGPSGDRLPGARSIRLNLANYNGVISAYAGREGLYMSVMFLFRPFHPPVLIPWGDIQPQGSANIFFFSYQKLKVGREGTVSLSIPQRWFDQIAPYLRNAAGGSSAGEKWTNDPFS